ncbi:MAG: uncharacterized protein JWO95_2657 [Verrucomicrobiales bacterium]|nr:uncharacterized protein [Verrucomicrobiales bacterium]
MKVDDIFSYADLVHAEKANLQRGMNFRIRPAYSIFLMSLRKNAPYQDAVDQVTGTLIYEGHNHPKTQRCRNPKVVDQPIVTPKGTLTENGKFFTSAMNFKNGVQKKAELIKVYEKLQDGIWSYKGFFELVDAAFVQSGRRKVIKFYLRPVLKKSIGQIEDLPHNRLIPSHVKLEVWKRDRGCCVRCGASKNLHYDHDIPFSKGGSSLTAENVRLLCVKHNLEKSDRIMCLMPWVLVGAQTAFQLGRK